MKPATISVVSILATLGTVTAIGFAQPDGIDPPAGPVRDTQPSLTSIDQRLAAIEADIQAVSETTGSSNVQVLYLESDTPSQLTAVPITTGRTRIISISGTRSNAVLFDGPGSFSGNDGPNTTGTVVGRLSQSVQQVIGSGAGQSFVYRPSTSTDINVVVENGLYIAHNISSWIAVYYEELP